MFLAGRTLAKLDTVANEIRSAGGSASTLVVDATAKGIEAALWVAIRALEDRSAMLARMADRAQSRGQARSARSFRRRGEAAEEHAAAVRVALAQATASSLATVELDDGEAVAPAEARESAA